MRRRAAAAILAGGQSRRMGADKALVLLDGRSLLARVIELLRPLFTEIAIIGGDAAAYRQFGLPVFPDHHPGAGALGGICTALLSAEAPLVFCCGCDMPFLKPAIVEHLLELARGDFEAVVPQVRGESEPLCAVYSRGALEVIEEEIAAGHRRIKDALARLRVRYVEEEELRAQDPGLHSFVNINTPEELEKARHMGSSKFTD